uniref:Retrotransposon gag domain-containing protein n=1 Tax=Peronospora matthiolae TaxID=2874970 RepID=A0AAV1UZZ2_9STRA
MSQRIKSEKGHLSQRIKSEEGHVSQGRESTVLNVKAEYTGSSRYASAESEMDSDESFGMQRMSLGPTGAAMLENKLDPAKSGIRSTQIPGSQNANTVKPSQLQLCFEAAMDKFIRDREEQGANYPIVPDVDMESVDSYRDRLGEHESDRRELYDLRRPQVATAGTAPTEDFSAQRIRLSAMADLKEFSVRDQDEERARGWFNKMKTAFLRDQAPEDEKCLVFGDLLTGPARNWYSQLSRSTRND